jgi:hypothetical protein
MKRNMKSVILLPAMHVERIWLVSLVAGIFLIGNAIVKPDIEPTLPADLDIGPITPELVTSESDAGLDFIFRPLFYASRRPQVAPADITEEATGSEVRDAAQASALSEYQLLGVFASGPVEGVILNKKGDDRRGDDRTRVYLGESLDGWILTRATFREALFENAQGESFTMGLAVASALPDLPTVAVRSQKTGQNGVMSRDLADPEASESSDKSIPAPAIERPNGPISFASMQARKREEAEREQQSRQASGE